MAKVAVVQVPFYSHVGAAMRLTGVLVRQGHEVAVWGPERCREQVEEWGARFELHEPKMPEVVAGVGYLSELIAATERLAEGLTERFHASELDLVIHDSQTPWARVAADYLGLPRIVLHPMFPIVAPYAKPSRADGWLPGPDPEEATERLEAHWRSIARRWGVEIESLVNVIHSSGETIVAFTTEMLIGNKALDDRWHLVGPLMPPPPPPAPPGARPLVYVCFGTAYNTRPELFRAVISGLANEPIDVLVSLGNGSFVSSADLAPLPGNVTVHEFVEARAVLARASVHVTHGGCNSVHETLLAGVPMVCMPQAYDQFPLSEAVERLGAGVIAEEDPLAVREAVRLLLATEKPHARAREISEHLREFDGERRVAELVERTIVDYAPLIRT